MNVALTITKTDSTGVAPIGCEIMCRTCDRCMPVMWAMEKWLAGWSIHRMREELNAQSFLVVADHYTAVNLLNNHAWLADMIARRLRGRGYWQVTTEQNEKIVRITVTDSSGPRQEFDMYISEDSLFAARYMLHAVMSTPRDVFAMVFKAFTALMDAMNTPPTTTEESYSGRHDKLFAAVVQDGDSADELANRLSVESFGWPTEFDRAIVAFRKLRTTARVQAAQQFLSNRKVVAR